MNQILNYPYPLTLALALKHRYTLTLLRTVHRGSGDWHWAIRAGPFALAVHFALGQQSGGAINTCQIRSQVTLGSSSCHTCVAWPANEHTLLVMHTHPGECHSPGVTKLAEGGMGCVCLMSTLPTSGLTVSESHSEFIRVGFGMGSAWVGHSQVRMSYTGRWESKSE